MHGRQSSEKNTTQTSIGDDQGNESKDQLRWKNHWRWNTILRRWLAHRFSGPVRESGNSQSTSRMTTTDEIEFEDEQIKAEKARVQSPRIGPMFIDWTFVTLTRRVYIGIKVTSDDMFEISPFIAFPVRCSKVRAGASFLRPFWPGSGPLCVKSPG
jgi:hypothetical protein